MSSWPGHSLLCPGSFTCLLPRAVCVCSLSCVIPVRGARPDCFPGRGAEGIVRDPCVQVSFCPSSEPSSGAGAAGPQVILAPGVLGCCPGRGAEVSWARGRPGHACPSLSVSCSFQAQACQCWVFTMDPCVLLPFPCFSVSGFLSHGCRCS